MKNSGNLVRIALFLLCMGAVLLGAGVIWTLSSRLQQIRTAEQSDPLWVASQLKFELLRLNSELAEYVFALKSAEDIAVRFDILWSRLGVMHVGKMAALIDEYNIDQTPLTDLKAALEDIDPLIQSLPGPNSAEENRRIAAREISARIRQFDFPVRQFSLELAQAKSKFMFEFRSGLLSLSRAIGYLGIVILALATIFVVLLLVDNKMNEKKSRQLKQMMAEVQASARMKDDFMSVVSHELRTPLTSILGGLGLLKRSYGESLEQGAKKMVDIAQRNAERLLSLVNDILDAQSLNDGKVSLENKKFNLVSVVSETIEQCDAYAHQFGVTYTFDASMEEIPVFVDQSRIAQVLTNFLSNAAKFSFVGNTVDVKVKREGQRVRVEIVDRGRGIPESEHKNLFSRFHQVNPGTTGATKSSGLGLSISKQLIEMHGGEVGFSSVEGKGSTFWFILPSESKPKSSQKDSRPIISVAT